MKEHLDGAGGETNVETASNTGLRRDVSRAPHRKEVAFASAGTSLAAQFYVPGPGLRRPQGSGKPSRAVFERAVADQAPLMKDRSKLTSFGRKENT